MSTFVEYDPTQFLVERRTLDGVWEVVPLATFSYASGYTTDENATLIIDAETASVSWSRWDTLGDDQLYPTDRVRVRYGSKVLFLGTVDTTRIAYASDEQAASYGATRRVDFSATLVGTYAAALERRACWAGSPRGTAVEWVRRFVTVRGWTP